MTALFKLKIDSEKVKQFNLPKELLCNQEVEGDYRDEKLLYKGQIIPSNLTEYIRIKNVY